LKVFSLTLSPSHLSSQQVQVGVGADNLRIKLDLDVAEEFPPSFNEAPKYPGKLNDGLPAQSQSRAAPLRPRIWIDVPIEQSDPQVRVRINEFRNDATKSTT
jgi:hypothetical protein